MTDTGTERARKSDRAVLTLALGPRVYWDMAVNLARSIRRWHSAADLPIAIATDCSLTLPGDLADVQVIRIRPKELGVGFETKLHLDRLAPAARTLFIDADCLVYARLDAVFSKFAGQTVGVVQERIASVGERFGDIAAYCRYLEVPAIPVFTGGVYYLERDGATSVYEEARRLFRHYDELGMVRLRGLPNEEVLVAGAMARHNLFGVPDDGTFTGDFQTSPGDHSFAILQGRRRMSNPPAGHALHCASAPVREIAPSIVHFLAYHTHLPPYRAETAALSWAAHGIPAGLAHFFSRLFILWPGLAMIRCKNALRPVYRRFFGFRQVPPTDRTTA